MKNISTKRWTELTEDQQAQVRASWPRWSEKELSAMRWSYDGPFKLLCGKEYYAWSATSKPVKN